MDIAKQHPEIYAQAREKGRDILSDPAKLRGALATRLGTDALQNTLEALSAKVDNAATITQIAKDLQEGKISKTEALSRALEQGEDVVEGIIWSAVSAGKSLYGQATTSSKDFEAVYGNGAGNEIESLTWGIIGASIAINGRHKGRGGKIKSGQNSPPPNLAPAEAGRRGAFRQVKRDAGIPVSQQPDKVTIIKDRATGKPIKLYEFVNRQGVKIEIRSDKYGHYYGEGNSQNRGSHFNSGKKGTKLKDHYDYK